MRCEISNQTQPIFTDSFSAERIDVTHCKLAECNVDQCSFVISSIGP